MWWIRLFNPHLYMYLQRTMKNQEIMDNRYAVGTLIRAKAFPEQQLVIDAYKQRIYYCAVVGSPEMKQFAYFDGELIDPAGRP